MANEERASARERPDGVAREKGEIAAARESVGYYKQRAVLNAFENGLREREAALKRECKGLGLVAEPRPLEEQKRQAWDAACEEARKAAGFTVAESQRLFEAWMRLEDWNPLARLLAERTEREILDAHATREREALEGAREDFKEKEEPRLSREFAEQRRLCEHWEARRSKTDQAAGEVKEGLGALAAAREDLRTMERAGVPRRELEAIMEGRECPHVEALRARIGEAKGALVQEVSVTVLRRELEPIVNGEAWGYDSEERKSAAWIIERLDWVKQSAQVCAARDLHHVLRAPENMAEQALEHVRREQTQERAREREIDQSRGMSMGR